MRKIKVLFAVFFVVMSLFFVTLDSSAETTKYSNDITYYKCCATEEMADTVSLETLTCIFKIQLF